MTEEANKNLDKCRACDGTVSKKAKICPHCGQKGPYKRGIGKGGWILIIIGLFFAQSILGVVQQKGSSNTSTSLPAKQSGKSNLSDPLKQQAWISKSQDGIRARLKDPDSAKFKDTFFVVWNSSPVVCGSVNSKNVMGGYTGFQKFIAAGESLAYLEEEVSDFHNVWNEMCSK